MYYCSEINFLPESIYIGSKYVICFVNISTIRYYINVFYGLNITIMNTYVYFKKF